MEKGSLIDRVDVGFKKPGTGINPMRIEEVLGRKLKRAVKSDDLLSMGDLI
tara:strand:- start:250 stop:402 length:153 start_codon:yes stop_codon:yes gene_type:complete